MWRRASQIFLLSLVSACSDGDACKTKPKDGAEGACCVANLDCAGGLICNGELGGFAEDPRQPIATCISEVCKSDRDCDQPSEHCGIEGFCETAPCSGERCFNGDVCRRGECIESSSLAPLECAMQPKFPIMSGTDSLQLEAFAFDANGFRFGFEGFGYQSNREDAVVVELRNGQHQLQVERDLQTTETATVTAFAGNLQCDGHWLVTAVPFAERRPVQIQHADGRPATGASVQVRVHDLQGERTIDSFINRAGFIDAEFGYHTLLSATVRSEGVALSKVFRAASGSSPMDPVRGSLVLPSPRTRVVSVQAVASPIESGFVVAGAGFTTSPRDFGRVPIFDSREHNDSDLVRGVWLAGAEHPFTMPAGRTRAWFMAVQPEHFAAAEFMDQLRNAEGNLDLLDVFEILAPVSAQVKWSADQSVLAAPRLRTSQTFDCAQTSSLEFLENCFVSDENPELLQPSTASGAKWKAVLQIPELVKWEDDSCDYKVFAIARERIGDDLAGPLGFAVGAAFSAQNSPSCRVVNEHPPHGPISNPLEDGQLGLTAAPPLYSPIITLVARPRSSGRKQDLRVVHVSAQLPWNVDRPIEVPEFLPETRATIKLSRSELQWERRVGAGGTFQLEASRGVERWIVEVPYLLGPLDLSQFEGLTDFISTADYVAVTVFASRLDSSFSRTVCRRESAALCVLSD